MEADEAGAYEEALRPLLHFFPGTEDILQLSTLIVDNVKWAKGRGNSLSHDEDTKAPEMRKITERMCVENPKMKRDNWFSLADAMDDVWKSFFATCSSRSAELEREDHRSRIHLWHTWGARSL